jgi:hypothetical protein
MEIIMRDIGEMIEHMDKAPITIIKINLIILENGKMTSLMEKGRKNM